MKLLLAMNGAQAVTEIRKRFAPGFSLDEQKGIHALPQGRFTCPNCHSLFTGNQHNPGCLLWFMVVVSLGIGLIWWLLVRNEQMCFACGYRWKN